MTETGSTTEEVETKLNSQLEPVKDWCDNNHMVINADKTKTMLLTTSQKRSRLENPQLDVKLGDSSLKMVKCEKLLGVLVDEDLTWTQQIQKVLKTVNAQLSLLRRIRKFLPIWCRKTYYNAYILPHLEYCCTIWGGGSMIDKLSKFQRRAARVILEADYQTPTSQLFATLSWMPLRDRIDYKRATLVYKSLNDLAPQYCRNMFKHVKDVNSRCTRLSSDPNKLYVNPRFKKCHILRTLAVSGANISYGIS